jgi:metallo-beta-lactamase class B
MSSIWRRMREDIGGWMATEWLVISRAVTLAGISAAPVFAADPQVTLSHIRGNVYLVEDRFYSKENSVVYIGDRAVTVIGATWTPLSAELLVQEIEKITPKPIKEVIDTNYHPDRAGGNAYFKSIGAAIVSTRMTYDLLQRRWDDMVNSTRGAFPDYPALPLVLPDKVFAGDFKLQSGRVRGIYLGPSHTPDGIFVYFPRERILYGNCILKEALGNLSSADLTEYPRTLEKLKRLRLGFTTIIAGHWSPLHGPELIDQYLQLLEGAQ